MTIRNDTYTMYKGKEYRILYHDGMAKLVSKNAEDLEKGFVEKVYDAKQFKYTPKQLAEKIYTLIVPPNEVGEVYSIKPYCLYQGYEFFILREENGHYILSESHTVTGGPLIEKFDFKRVGKYEYEKAVKKEDVDLVYEKKTLMPNFFK